MGIYLIDINCFAAFEFHWCSVLTSQLLINGLPTYTTVNDCMNDVYFTSENFTCVEFFLFVYLFTSFNDQSTLKMDLLFEFEQ